MAQEHMKGGGKIQKNNLDLTSLITKDPFSLYVVGHSPCIRQNFILSHNPPSTSVTSITQDHYYSINVTHCEAYLHLQNGICMNISINLRQMACGISEAKDDWRSNDGEEDVKPVDNQPSEDEKSHLKMLMILFGFV